eukprot:scaffold133839_cov32-Tisochrysis_lutea.AAC.3
MYSCRAYIDNFRMGALGNCFWRGAIAASAVLAPGSASTIRTLISASCCSSRAGSAPRPRLPRPRSRERAQLFRELSKGQLRLQARDRSIRAAG